MGMGWNEELRNVKGGERVLTRCCFGGTGKWGGTCSGNRWLWRFRGVSAMAFTCGDCLNLKTPPPLALEFNQSSAFLLIHSTRA